MLHGLIVVGQHATRHRPSPRRGSAAHINLVIFRLTVGAAVLAMLPIDAVDTKRPPMSNTNSTGLAGFGAFFFQ